MIKFGTSGFRGIMGDNFTKRNVQKLANALVRMIIWQEIKEPVVDIAFDNRFMSRMYAEWMAEAFAGYKIRVNFFTEATPTPTLAYMSKQHAYGIMVTASHNPYYYNGVKVFSGGAELDDKTATTVCRLANGGTRTIQVMPYAEALESGIIVETTDTSAYQDSVLSFVNKKQIAKNKVKVLFNPMHGNATKVVKEICKKIGYTNFDFINEDIDPFFEHKLPAPYVQNLGEQSKMVKNGYDFGVAFDGDSDRIGLIDECGNIYDCNDIFPLVFSHLAKTHEGGVARNYAFSSLISHVAEAEGRKEFLTQVGFKNIAPLLKSGKCFIGAETNGIAIGDHVACKDGIIIAFILIDMFSKNGQTVKTALDKIRKKFKFPSKTMEFAYPITKTQKDKINKLVFKDKKLPNVDRKLCEVIYTDGMKMLFENGYWLTIRFSGNEPVVRFFAEMENEEKCNEIFKILEDFTGLHVRQ